MESRWAVLAVKAWRHKYIDYKTITANDEFSLIQESLIFRDLERDILSNIYSISLISVQNSDEKVKLYRKYIKTLMPWALIEDDKPTAERLTELYRKLVNNKVNKNGE